MSTATKEHTPPTRRSAMRFSLAALAAGIATPALAAAPGPDANIIDLCSRLLAVAAEEHLICQHDEYAPDYGPNHQRYQQLTVEQRRLMGLIKDAAAPATTAGFTAVARAALAWADRDGDGNIVYAHFGEQLLTMLAEGVATGFVWPPRPGSCSTAHWAPATPAAYIAAEDAKFSTWVASVDAEIKAKKEAEEAEGHRRWTPSLMTDDELRKADRASRELSNIALERRNELLTEMVLRGVV